MVFLTGASGFLGKSLIDKFSKLNIEVCCLSRYKRHASNSNIRWQQIDLTALPFPSGLLEGCSVIVHAAAAMKGAQAKLNNLNYHVTRELLAVAKRNMVKKFIFISSTDTIVSDSTYAKSKRNAEEAVKNSGLRWLIIRPPVIFGADDTKNIVFLDNIIKKFPIIPLPYQGLFRWQPVFVDDLAEYIVKCVIDDNIYNRCLNIVGPETLTFCQVVCQLEKHNKVKRLKIPLSLPVTNFLKSLASVTLGPHRTDEIFSSFKDKIVPEGYGEKIKLPTRFNQIYG